MVSFLINSIERKQNIQAYSLNIRKTITKKRNTCGFNIVSTRENPYKPNIGQEVIITDDATKIFAGVITSIETTPMSNNMVQHQIECQDYSRLLDRKLIPDSFSNQTVDEIIAFLQTRYFPSDVTINNVDCPVNVKTARFNYKQLYDVLDELAKRTGYDWYIDYDKDVHFFKRDSIIAPFDVTDTAGNYILDSMKIRSDNTQLRNTIIVRGGNYDGATFTAEIEANGVDFIFPLGYQYKDFNCTLTGQPLSIGIDYINSPDSFDALYNYQEKIIRFKESDIPSAGAILRPSGRPKLPVIVKYSSTQSINSTISTEGGDGIYEYLIIDKSITSKEEARTRARVEVETYGESLIDASFSTLTSGLEAGQKIRINSDLMGVNETYIIQSVNIEQYTEDTFKYNIDLISQKSFDVISILKSLIMKDTERIEISENETIDIVLEVNETLEVTDSVSMEVTGNGVYKYNQSAKWNFSTWQ